MSSTEVAQVLETLRRIEEPSKFLLDSSKPNNMLGRWAKDYYEGAYANRQAEINNALSEGKTAASTGQGGNNNEGGASYIRIIDGCANIGDAWRQLPQQFDAAASKKELVEVIYDPYKNAIWEYSALLEKFAVGLAQKDAAYWVGAIFIRFLKTHKGYFEECKPKVAKIVQALDKGEREEIEKRTARMDKQFAAALKAAGA